jgi:hypothetical protein
LTSSQQEALLSEGATAVAQYDERNNADEKARTRAANSVSPPLVALPVSSSTADTAAGARYDGSYLGSANPGTFPSRLSVSLQVANGRGVGVVAAPGCQESNFIVSVPPTGEISGEVYFNCIATISSGTISAGTFKITGEYQRKGIQLDFRSQRSSFMTAMPSVPREESRGAALVSAGSH